MIRWLPFCCSRQSPFCLFEQVLGFDRRISNHKAVAFSAVFEPFDFENSIGKINIWNSWTIAKAARKRLVAAMAQILNWK